MTAKALLGTPLATRPHPMDIHIPNENDDWTSEAYDWLNGRRRRVRAGKCPATRVLAAVLSFILAALGVGLIVWIVILGAQTQAPFYLSSVFGTALGAFLLVLGVFGLASAGVDRPTVLALLAVILSFFAFAVLILGAAAVAVIVSPALPSVEFLRGLWVSAVEWDPPLVCEVQRRLGCSGYGAGHCCVSNATTAGTTMYPCYLVTGNATLDPVTLREVTWPAEVCAPQCTATNVFTRSCENPLEDRLHASIGPLTAILLSFGVFLVAFSIIAVCRAMAKRRAASYIRYEY